MFLSGTMCLIAFLLMTAGGQQSPKSAKGRTKPQPVKHVYVTLGSASASGGPMNREPYLSLEPCAKETDAQISDLENADNLEKQLNILVLRAQDSDSWNRACAVYRLGEFRSSAQDALPLIIKLLKDEKDESVWIHVETALWKVPPDRNTPLEKRIQLARDQDVYGRLLAVYSLGYFKPVAGSFQAKDTLNALIDATRDEDRTVAWMGVMGIRQFGFYGIDTSSAIPALSDVIDGDKLNPINAVRAIVPMGERAIAAAPLLFQVLYDPKKFVGKDDNKSVSYVLYLTAAIALGRIGESLVPLLEKESNDHPFEAIQVLSNMDGDKMLTLLLRLAENPNANVKVKAISALPRLTSIGAMQALPVLLSLMDDSDVKVSQAAVSQIGNIGKFTKEKSPELQRFIQRKVIPKLMSRVDLKDNCYPLMTLGDFGDAATVAIPALAKQSRKGSICAQTALYEIGPKGRKYLTPEKLAEEERERQPGGLYDFSGPDRYNKAKPIKPKSSAPEKKVTVKDA
jgi:HEAT repeat protein